MSDLADVRRRGRLAECARLALLRTNRIASGLDRFARRATTDSPSPLFVVGLPRAGTTLAYELIVQAFEVAYFSRIFEYCYGIPNLSMRLCRPFTRDRRPKYQSRYGRIPGLFAPAENHNFWLRWFPERAGLGHYAPAVLLNGNDRASIQEAVSSISAIAGRPFVFKDVYLALSLESLLQTFKRGRILVITRETAAIASSIYRRRAQLGRRDLWWSIRPPLAEHVVGRELAEQVAFQCIRSEQVLNKQVSELSSDRVMLADYADICRAPNAFIAAAASWLGEEYELRSDPIIPQSFEIRPPVQIAEHARQQLAKHSVRFSADRDEYLLRVNALASAIRTGN